jgi:hypothetical protein
MCNPALIVPIITAVGAGVGVYGQIQAGKDANRIERQNAKNLELSAMDAQRRGDLEEQEHRNQVRAMLGSQRAAFGASNVDSNTGSPLGLLVDTARFGEIDALTIRNNAAREAWGFRTGAHQARARGKAGEKSGIFQGTGTALAGGAQAYGEWKKGKAA